MNQSKSDIIRVLFAAYLSNDRKGVENAFTEDFRFTSPMMTRSTKPPISRGAGASATGSTGRSWKEFSLKVKGPS